MIKTTFPIVEKIIDEENDKIITNNKSIEVNVDTSLFAEERWEANFPNNARNETLFAYIERVSNAGLVDNKSHIVANLKALYCFLEGDNIADFKSFCQMFDISDPDYFAKLVNKIKFVFNLVLNGSAVTSKN